MEIQWDAFIGLIGGLIVGLAGWYFGRKAAKKERGIDEVHNYIWQKARAYSWYVTTLAIYVLFFLSIFGVSLSVVGVLGILMIVHLFSWAMIGLFLSCSIYNENKSDKQIYLFLFASFIVLGLAFTIILIVTK